MKRMSWGKRITGFLAAVLLCLTCCGEAVQAYGIVDTEAPTSLTLRYQDNGEGIEGAGFSLYRIGEISETGKYTLTEEFAGYPVSLDELDSSGWRSLAQTLAAYAQRDGIEPDRTGVTGSDGVLRFQDLDTGLFLVTGEKLEYQEKTYTAESFICSLPGLSEDDTWQYDVESSVKYECVTNPDLVSWQVVKVWKNDNESSRPDSIEVQLLKNGSVADTQVLSKENNGRYTWTGLDGASSWTVVEKTVPQGYQVSVAKEETSIIITNSGSSGKTTTSDGPEGNLPQTGVLWWPVPVLAAAGLLLFLAGWTRSRKQESENE